MSAPAAKAFWEPVRRMMEMDGEESKDLRAELSSLIKGVERALRALGRLRVTCPTPGRGSVVWMNSYMRGDDAANDRVKLGTAYDWK